VKPIARKDWEPEHVQDGRQDSGIFLAACRIVASGYKAEVSQGADSLFMSAAYQLLHGVLERLSPVAPGSLKRREKSRLAGSERTQAR